MLRLVQRVILWSLILNIGYGLSPMTKSTWNFEFVSVETNSSDHSRLKIDLDIVAISRGVYGLSGTLDVNFDVQVGDNTIIEALVYRSATGSSEYKLTPFTVKRQHLFDFFNTFYKDMLMNSLTPCSNLPKFEKKFEPPFEKKTYKLDNCLISNEGMPQHMLEGYYKVVFIGTGNIDFAFQSIVKVQNGAM